MEPKGWPRNMEEGSVLISCNLIAEPGGENEGSHDHSSTSDAGLGYRNAVFTFAIGRRQHGEDRRLAGGRHFFLHQRQVRVAANLHAKHTLRRRGWNKTVRRVSVLARLLSAVVSPRYRRRPRSKLLESPRPSDSSFRNITTQERRELLRKSETQPLPELFLVVVRRSGEGGWHVHRFGSLRDGASQKVLLSSKRDVKRFRNQTFGHCREERR